MSVPPITPTPPHLTRRLVVTGRVQGVGFRMFMTREAQAAGVIGWVRNRRDGTVEAVVQGPATAVERIIAWASKGPPTGHVNDLRIEPAEGEFKDFLTRPTE
jgi:acylphosphatase